MRNATQDPVSHSLTSVDRWRHISHNIDLVNFASVVFAEIEYSLVRRMAA
jgi:hypothetical protein